MVGNSVENFEVYFDSAPMKTWMSPKKNFPRNGYNPFTGENIYLKFLHTIKLRIDRWNLVSL